MAPRDVLRAQPAGQARVGLAHAERAAIRARRLAPTASATPVPPSAPGTYASSSRPSPAIDHVGHVGGQRSSPATRHDRPDLRRRIRCADVPRCAPRVDVAVELNDVELAARRAMRAISSGVWSANTPTRRTAVGDAREHGRRALRRERYAARRRRSRRRSAAPSDTAYSASSARVSPQNLISASRATPRHAGQRAHRGRSDRPPPKWPSRRAPRRRRSAATRSTSPRAATPLSAIATTTAGIEAEQALGRGAGRSSSVSRLRLLMPMTVAPASSARSQLLLVAHFDEHLEAAARARRRSCSRRSIGRRARAR